MKIMFLLLTIMSAPVFADQFVSGYVRSDGTYVEPHFRSSPDSSTYNNYSSRGNSNPYTGERGTVDPYQARQQRQQQPYQYQQPYQNPYRK